MTVLTVEQLEHVVKPHFWSRTRPILKGVSLAVEPGEIFGFLGPNGAGKTTTIKCILGLVRASRGEVRLFGQSPHQQAVRARLGFLPEGAYYPEQLSGFELVVQHGILSGLGLSMAKQRAKEVLNLVGLSHKARQRLRTYSKGMLQRVGLAQALIGNPDLLILDEPMSGLDPIGRRDIRRIMTALCQAGKTIFFSTHILPDVEAICHRVAIIAGGESREQGTLDELMGQSIAKVEIVSSAPSPEANEVLRSHGLRPQSHSDGALFEAPDLEAANRTIDLLRASGVSVLGMQRVRCSLEELFVNAAGIAGGETEEEERPAPLELSPEEPHDGDGDSTDEEALS